MTTRGHFLADEEPHIDTAHAELHHYSGWRGLEGIWTSQALFGTRFDCLNDITEIRHFQEFLAHALTDKIKPIVAKEAKSNRKMAELIPKHGGLDNLSKIGAEDFVSKLYDQTFSVSDPGKGMAVPFITSFCSHTIDQPYERENGLLSQWRGYNAKTGERYALVFDTKRLSKKMERESEAFDYLLHLADVIYNDDTVNFSVQFHEVLDASADKLKYQLSDKEVPLELLQKLFNSFILGASRFKHRAFHEEREVRLISFVRREECMKRLYSQYGQAVPDFKYKPTFLDMADCGKERIKLFLGDSEPALPITRIIVGPHKDQSSLYDKVHALTGEKIPIVKSATPYVG